MHTGSYVNGKWYHPSTAQTTRNINPADTADVIAEFPLAGAADVRLAVDAAVEAAKSWRKTPGPERGRVLWRAADIARRRVDEIAQTLTREEGKILKEAKGEVLKGIAVLEYNAGAGFRMHGQTLPSESRDTFTYTLRQPLGAVGLIAPWNFPWAIPVWKSAPAIVAGNAVVFKPSELTPATSALLAEIYEEAGLPPGVFNMVVGRGSVVGEAMVAAPQLRAISFTGSNAVGGALYVKAAQRGAKVTCEMGGKNAVIVMPDADLDKAAVAIHGGAFGSTGQRCTATSRVIAHPDIKQSAGRPPGRDGGEDQARSRSRSVIGHGTVGRREAVVNRHELRRRREVGRRAPAHRWQPAGRVETRLLRRTHDLRRCRADDAHLQGGSVRPGAGDRNRVEHRRGVALRQRRRIRT